VSEQSDDKVHKFIDKYFGFRNLECFSIEFFCV